MRTRLSILGVAAFLLGPCCLQIGGTTLIVFYAPGLVYIGADSKAANGYLGKSWEVCKIHVADNYVWASGGISSELNGPFKIDKFVPEAMGRGAPFYSSVDKLQSRLKSKYLELMKHIKPVTSQDNIVIILANRKLPGESSALKIGPKGFERRDCPAGFNCGRPASFFSAEEHDEVDRVARARPDIWQVMGVPGAIDYLLKREEEVHPELVEKPNVIIKIDTQGVQWIQKGDCQK